MQTFLATGTGVLGKVFFFGCSLVGCRSSMDLLYMTDCKSETETHGNDASGLALSKYMSDSFQPRTSLATFNKLSLKKSL